MCVILCSGRDVFVLGRERDRTQCIETSKIVFNKKNKNQQLQRGGEGAYVVTFSLFSLITIASWERGGDLTTY